MCMLEGEKAVSTLFLSFLAAEEEMEQHGLKRIIHPLLHIGLIFFKKKKHVFF